LAAALLLAAGPAAAQGFQAKFTALGGVKLSPAYIGSDSYELKPTASFQLDYLRLPGGYRIGSPERDYVGGFRPRFSFRYLGDRNAGDGPEIAGLEDIETSVELGAGVGYEARDFRVFADVRNGVIGHNDWVGEVGADAIARPNAAWTLSAGPRFNFGGPDFVDTYFGVTPVEAARSGLPAYDPSSGLVSVGMELSARYEFTGRWGVEGIAAYERLVDDAAASPVVDLGSPDQYQLRLGLTREISLGF
jgi:outer membrane scaffolding protein for murein synthesis (MipA/OmpV family)